MRDLDQGHQMLKERKFQEAYDYFTMMATLYGHVPQTLNGCIYGQARALCNMKQSNKARQLLMDLIVKVPNWEAPYITLARLDETEGQTLKLLGKSQDASQYFKNADNTYQLAMKQTKCSERLKQHYEYFLNDCSVPLKKQNTFTPGFNHQSQRKAALTATTTPNANLAPFQSNDTSPLKRKTY